ncbi:MAG: DNA replication and repair protein RecF [Chlorobiaceae bacterium]|nr:DNA replication and repair protein RecF [Chlorobiaceae bacterium]
MILQRISYENFRNHRSLTYEPEEGINLIYGPNGSGKTSMLEGIHYCALTKGFVSAGDGDCLEWSADFFTVRGEFRSDAGRELQVQISYTKQKEKQLFVNQSEVKPFSRHVGSIPCITFSPSETGIVTGMPSERRKFIDNAISQTDRRYLEDLLEYRRVLAQRNALLMQLSERKTRNDATLSVWSEKLAEIAASITMGRKKFVDDFSVRIGDMYRELDVREDPGIVYRASLPGALEEEQEERLRGRFLDRYRSTEENDIMRGQTLTGPHRDDLGFLLGGRDARRYASQGQIRTFLICLKLSQQRFYGESLGESPICLLDDIFSELDSRRIQRILEVLGTFGQSVITSTENRKKSNIKAISIEKFSDKEEEQG